jgi:hypothetical protein
MAVLRNSMSRMQSILRLAPAATSTAFGGARGQTRQLSAAPVGFNQARIKNELEAFNNLKASGIAAGTIPSEKDCAHTKWVGVIPMKDPAEIKAMIRDFNKKRSK